jgi:hypothetical protein
VGKQPGAPDGAISVAWTSLATRLFSPGEPDLRLSLRQVALTGAHAAGPVTLTWFAGVPVSGALQPEGGDAGQRLSFGSGAAGGLGVSWPLWTTYDQPFALDLSAQLAASHTTLRPDGGGADGAALALDVRFAATASRTFQRNLALWGAVRAFGGPLFVTRGDGGERATVVASDTRHVQLATGLSLALLPRALPQLRLSVEARAVAEWGLSAGVSWGL